MRIVTATNGKKAEHDIPARVKAIVHTADIKITAPEAYTITPEDTLKCMREMSQKAWEHISTGELFQHLFKLLFRDTVQLPAQISTLNEDYSEGVVHGCGLIILMVEAMFEKKPQMFIKTPETYLHPQQQYYLMTLLLEIEKLGGIKGMQV